MRVSTDTQRRIAALASRQNGNITFDQLREHGLSRSQIWRRADSGLLIRRHEGVYAVGHRPRTQVAAFHAAALAFDDGVSSYRAAGVLWEVVRGAVPNEVTVPPTAGFAKRDGIIVHRQSVPSEHRRVRHGVPVTSLVRTVLDLASVYRVARLAQVFEEAQVRHQLDPAVLAAEVISRPGHRGSGRLRIVLADAVDPAGVRSILELRFLRLCLRAGLPRPVVNERLGPWTLDFLWPAQRVVVETDGYAFHRTPAKRKRDARKDDDLRRLGLTVIRLTWADVTERPDETVSIVLDALSVS